MQGAPVGQRLLSSSSSFSTSCGLGVSSFTWTVSELATGRENYVRSAWRRAKERHASHLRLIHSWASRYFGNRRGCDHNKNIYACKERNKKEKGRNGQGVTQRLIFIRRGYIL